VTPRRPPPVLRVTTPTGRMAMSLTPGREWEQIKVLAEVVSWATWEIVEPVASWERPSVAGAYGADGGQP
jgi:hypothetical protein